jgi:archaemetzincin
VTSEALGLIPLAPSLDYPLDSLIDPISVRFPSFNVSVTTPSDEPTEAYDLRRSQYHSTRILAFLERHIRNLRVERLLGVIAKDLYAPGMNFVFGEARSPGTVAVISTYRLKPSNPYQTDLLQSRVLKEAVHEIGHMTGLKHCFKAECVMHFSKRLADTDLKSPNFCDNCRSHLRVSY